MSAEAVSEFEGMVGTADLDRHFARAQDLGGKQSRTDEGQSQAAVLGKPATAQGEFRKAPVRRLAEQLDHGDELAVAFAADGAIAARGEPGPPFADEVVGDDAAEALTALVRREGKKEGQQLSLLLGVDVTDTIGDARARWERRRRLSTLSIMREARQASVIRSYEKRWL